MWIFSVIAMVLVLWAGRKGRLDRKVRILLLALNALLLVGSLKSRLFPEEQQVTSVERRNAGEADEKLQLEARVEGEEDRKVTITVPSRVLSEEEVSSRLAEAAARVEQSYLGENPSADRVSLPLVLPGRYEDLGVEILWSSSAPALLSIEGNPTGEADPNGSPVTLYGELSLQDERQFFSKELTVFPPAEKLAERELQVAAAEGNDPGSATFRLPDSWKGKKVTWFLPGQDDLGILALLGLAAVLLLISKEEQDKKDAVTRKKEALKRAYPDLVGKLQLYLGAGLTLRRTFERLALEEREQVRSGKPADPLGEELLRTGYEMATGVSEAEAYERFGDRCGETGYRNLSLMLVQNLRKGSQKLVPLLEQEAQGAYAERKRKAKEAGEKAGTKLILPMILMLMVVLALVLVPAFLSF